MNTTMERRRRLNLDDRCLLRADELVPFTTFVIAQDWQTGAARCEQVLEVELLGEDVRVKLSRTGDLWTSAGNTFVVV